MTDDDKIADAIHRLSPSATSEFHNSDVTGFVECTETCVTTMTKLPDRLGYSVCLSTDGLPSQLRVAAAYPMTLEFWLRNSAGRALILSTLVIDKGQQHYHVTFSEISR